MTILLDTRPLQNAYADRGVGTVIRNLYSRFACSTKASQYRFCGRPGAAPLSGVSWGGLYRPSRHWMWEHLLWPIDMIRLRGGTLFCPAALGPIREIALPLLSPLPRVAMVYDLNCLHDPDLSWQARSRSFKIQVAALRKVRQIVTISRFVANDLVQALGIEQSRISVIPCGVDDRVRELNKSMAQVPPPQIPFVLALGESANKNIAAVIAVFDRLVAKGFDGDCRIVGRSSEQTLQVQQLCASSPFASRIHFVGSVGTAQLVKLYKTCAVFLFPSRHEGFGLPVIEAQACGAPVIVSNAASLPEAAGDRALAFDPEDHEGMAEAAGQLISDLGFRRKEIDRGLLRTATQTWDSAAIMIEKLLTERG